VTRRVTTPKNSGRLHEREIVATSDPLDLATSDSLGQADNSVEGPRFVVTPLVVATATHYKEIGLSEREIAGIMGIPHSKIHKMVKDVVVISPKNRSRCW